MDSPFRLSRTLEANQGVPASIHDVRPNVSVIRPVGVGSDMLSFIFSAQTSLLLVIKSFTKKKKIQKDVREKKHLAEESRTWTELESCCLLYTRDVDSCDERS